MIGPLIFTLFFISAGSASKTASDYRQGYSLFWIPFLMLVVVLLVTYYRLRNHSGLESKPSGVKEPEGIPRVFWFYSLFAFITTFGFVNFAMIGYHLKANGLVSDAQIPFLYSGYGHRCGDGACGWEGV